MVLRQFPVTYVLLALFTALVVSFFMTPLVKSFAYKVGAIDVPKDNRRMHKEPIPRLGGLAIFFGCMISTLLFATITPELRSILLGAVVIVILGVIDDSLALSAALKFVVQIGAALIPALSGVTVQVFSNPNILSENPYWRLGTLALPVTVLWIVAVTNSVNLIDGLDGLAAGVSTISGMTMLVIALMLGEMNVSIVLSALVGACLGFLPYNLNPAKMFMGDTGATFLGYILATMSILGLFKYYAVISFVVPFLILGLPIFDTTFAFIRRLATGHNPMHADRGHIHHRLIDMGLSQKQAVATLYVISGILGLSAVVLTTEGEQRAMLLLAALCITAVLSVQLVFPREFREEIHREFLGETRRGFRPGDPSPDSPNSPVSPFPNASSPAYPSPEEPPDEDVKIWRSHSAPEEEPDDVKIWRGSAAMGLRPDSPEHGNRLDPTGHGNRPGPRPADAPADAAEKEADRWENGGSGSWQAD